MAKLKLKKLPKKPKANASNAVKLRYLEKVKQVCAENKHIESENKKSVELSKKIAGIGSASSLRSFAPKKRKKPSTTTKKKKTVKRKK
jgi:hypothetical protein